MDFKEMIARRRSIRKFTAQPVPAEVIDRLLAPALTAPSARNTRSTNFLVVDDPARIARMAEMRDYGSAFLKDAPLVIVVMGDTAKSDLWEVNASIAATMLQLACVDEGLGVVLGTDCRATSPERSARRRKSCRLPAHLPADFRGDGAALCDCLRLLRFSSCRPARSGRQGSRHSAVNKSIKKIPSLKRGGIFRCLSRSIWPA